MLGWGPTVVQIPRNVEISRSTFIVSQKRCGNLLLRGTGPRTGNLTHRLEIGPLITGISQALEDSLRLSMEGCLALISEK
jgi:hypothetical protein